MKKHDEFIAVYKDLETAILCKYNKEVEASGQSPVLFYEGTGKTDSTKLKYCRLTRNYIQHESDYEVFIAISDEMIKFMKDTITELTGTIKAISLPLKSNTVCVSDKIYDIAPLIKKRKTVVVFDQDTPVGTISASDIIDFISNGPLSKTTKVQAVMNKGGTSCVYYANADESVICVKDKKHGDIILVRGKTGKLVGIYYC